MKIHEPYAWKTQLWMELDNLTPEDQFATLGEWIVYVTQVLLPELGERRRENVMTIMERDGSNSATVAAQLGKRPSTIARLVDEGRSARKAQRSAAMKQETAAAA